MSKSTRFEVFHHTYKAFVQLVSFIIYDALTSDREALAWWASDNHIDILCPKETVDLFTCQR